MLPDLFFKYIEDAKLTITDDYILPSRVTCNISCFIGFKNLHP